MEKRYSVSAGGEWGIWGIFFGGAVQGAEQLSVCLRRSGAGQQEGADTVSRYAGDGRSGDDRGLGEYDERWVAFGYAAAAGMAGVG